MYQGGGGGGGEGSGDNDEDDDDYDDDAEEEEEEDDDLGHARWKIFSFLFIANRLNLTIKSIWHNFKPNIPFPTFTIG